MANPGPGAIEGETAHRIVVGVDGSPSSLEALAWAAHEAQVRGTALEVVRVRFFRKDVLDLAGEADRSEQQALDTYVSQVKELEPTVPVVGRLADPPADKVLIAASRHAELLVVGSRGIGGIKELTLGSVSQQCAHRAHCPVVIIRG